jgi:hypothetical protein
MIKTIHNKIKQFNKIIINNLHIRIFRRRGKVVKEYQCMKDSSYGICTDKRKYNKCEIQSVYLN